MLLVLALLDCAAQLTQLRAPRASTTHEYRQLLETLNLTYPDDKGMFVERRPTKTEPDWLALLQKLEVAGELERAKPDAIDVVRGIRQIAAECHAVRPLLDFAFEPAGNAFRDEVGRQIRAIGDPAVAELVRTAYGTGKIARGERRYANWQLDKMDRQRPESVMAQVRDDKLRAEILHAYGEVRPPAAVHAVLGECDASSPRVRKSARWAWMQYVTQAPPEPPKRKLKLAGGKESDEEKELYLSYRELADLEIRRQWPALMNEPADPARSLADLSAALFAHQDAERNKRWDALFAQAEDKRKQGDLAGAVGLYGWILAQDPFYARRTEMAPGLRAFAEQLASQGRFAEAAGWLRQARALGADLDGELARIEAAAHPAPPPPKRRTLPLAAALAAIAIACTLAWRRVRATAG